MVPEDFMLLFYLNDYRARSIILTALWSDERFKKRLRPLGDEEESSCHDSNITVNYEKSNETFKNEIPTQLEESRLFHRTGNYFYFCTFQKVIITLTNDGQKRIFLLQVSRSNIPYFRFSGSPRLTVLLRHS